MADKVDDPKPEIAVTQADRDAAKSGVAYDAYGATVVPVSRCIVGCMARC